MKNNNKITGWRLIASEGEAKEMRATIRGKIEFATQKSKALQREARELDDYAATLRATLAKWD